MKEKILALTVGGVLALTIAGAVFIASPMEAQKTVPQPAETMTRQERGEKVLNSLSGGKGLPPHFVQLQKDFPELADMTLKYSLGDIWGREVLDNKTRQLVALAGFAAQGTMPQFKVHAQYALNYGATPEELMEVIYITTVTSGSPRALIAAGTLKELFQENQIKFPITSQK
ncbi:carboxymuconolactone decarboxylase family protein [Microcoleus sp. herbarium19]|uniref:carboxymuconolactone decarboxylase family protein n=1 Tax=unclassified Microcoleus TaxID=2642155 RepID=UPI002FD12E0C